MFYHHVEEQTHENIINDLWLWLLSRTDALTFSMVCTRDRPDGLREITLSKESECHHRGLSAALHQLSRKQPKEEKDFLHNAISG